jgi:hypothetical protein
MGWQDMDWQTRKQLVDRVAGAGLVNVWRNLHELNKRDRRVHGLTHEQIKRQDMDGVGAQAQSDKDGVQA